MLRPALVVVALVGLALGCFRCTGAPPTAPERPAGPPRNVLLITVDTLRADHLGCYGYERITTPAIDALARSGTLYRHAISPAPWTCPAMASMVTSLYPEQHGVVMHPIIDYPNFRALSPSHETFAEVLASAGYRTHALSEQAWFSPEFGFAQGFFSFELLPTSARALTAAAIARLETLAGQASPPFFLNLHFIDPHTPYTPPTEFQPPSAAGDPFGLAGLDDNAWWQRLGKIDGNDPTQAPLLAHLNDLYDGEIRFVDQAIGQVLAAVDRLGLTATTAVVLVSDHGEAFGEHAMLHGSTLHNEELHVPLIIRVPWDERFQGQTVADAVSTMDLMPTLLAALGLPAPAAVEGKDIAPGGTSEPPRYVFSESTYDRVPRKAQSAKFSLIVDPSRGVDRFFDLTVDPSEQRDARTSHPSALTAHREALGAWLRAHQSWTVAPVEPAKLSEDLEERLRALGYLQ